MGFDALKKNNRTRAAVIVTALLGALALGAAGVSLVREASQKHRLEDRFYKERVPSRGDAARWLAAVESGDEARALLLAEKIAPSRAELPDADLLRLMSLKGVSTTFLTDGFRGFDFQRWREAAELRRLARSLTPDRSRAAAELFHAVKRRFQKNGAAPGADFTPPLKAWESGVVGEAERTRLYAGLCGQLGLEAVLVMIEDEKGNRLADVCEVHDPATGRRDVAVFSDGVIIENKSMRDLLCDPSSAGWPERLVKARAGNVFVIQPSEAADFRTANIRLREALRRAGSDAPEFGGNPAEALERQIDCFRGAPNKKGFGYWDLPLEAARGGSAFEKRWSMEKASEGAGGEKK